MTHHYLLKNEPGENNFWKWCGRRNIVVQYHRGKSLNGNECRDVLELLDDLATFVPAHLMKFIDALRAFNYGWNHLEIKLLKSFFFT